MKSLYNLKPLRWGPLPDLYGWGGGWGDYVLMYEMGETDNEYSGDKK